MIWLDDAEAAPGLAPRDIAWPDTVVSLARVGSLAGDLFPEEAAYVAGSVPVRRREFETGRALSRRCMGALNVASRAVPRRADRSPVWPAGTVGSLSHCRHLAVAALSGGLETIGVDVECTGRIEPKLHDVLFTADERRLAGGEPAVTALFSAKEALFKAFHPLTRARAEFKEVEVALDLAAGRFRARYLGKDAANALIDELTGYVAAADGHVLAIAVKVKSIGCDGRPKNNHG